MKVCFLITTYGRQESCQRLVNSLQGQGDIVVLGDGVDYTIENCTFINHNCNYGKRNYYKTVNDLFRKRTKADYYFMLPDDFLPVPNMVEIAVETFQNIDDPEKICLNLFADRIGCACWTGFTPIDKGNVWLTQWVDMCFVCTEFFFIILGRIPHTISYNSSGVGRHISCYLKNRRKNLYQVKESLVIPQEEHNISQMQRYDDMPHRLRPHSPRKSRIHGR